VRGTRRDHGPTTLALAAVEKLNGAKSTLTLAAGQSTTALVSLNRAGVHLLAALHTIKAKLSVTETGQAPYVETVVFNSKRKQGR
jgi:hypothetical protein